MGAADNDAPRNDRWNLDEIEFLLPPPQSLHRSRLTVTEGEVSADAQCLCSQSLHKILLDECVRCERGELRVELHRHEEFDPRAFDKPQLLLECADQFGGQVGREDTYGVRI